MTLCEKLIDLRRKAGLSQEQMAQQLDVSRQAVSKWETGESLPDTNKLLAIGRLLGVTVDYLLADSVTGGDETILDEFKQIVDNQPLERKLMALQVLRTIFAYFEKEGA